MMDESTRQAYLQVMGVTQWQLRSEETDILEVAAVETKIETETTPEIPKPLVAKGLSWLNKSCVNGLLVVFSEQRQNLTAESRNLISKMLNSIHFLPSETGFAIISDAADSNNEACTLDSVTAILVMGNEAGRQLVKIAGARIIPGSDVFTLQGRKIIISLHPDELISNPENKKQAWADLKQLTEFFKDN